MTLLREKEEAHIVTDSDRAELQSHFPYAGIHLNELSVQEERLLLFHLRGMSKAAAGRADSATQININVDKVEQLEKLSDAELLKRAGQDKHYLEPGDAD